MARQLRLDLPARQALGREDFFVSPANAAAVAMIESWQTWPARKLLLSGASGAGKTHLVHVWAGLAGAEIIAAADLPDADIPALAGHNMSPSKTHIGSQATAEGGRGAFPSAQSDACRGAFAACHRRDRPPNGLWELVLPDLASRMQGTALVALEAPDDDLLAAVLMKLFDDRQLSPAPDTIPLSCAAHGPILRGGPPGCDRARRCGP